MSGGIAYIWDFENSLKHNFNPDMADIEGISEKDAEVIFDLLQKHVEETNSEIGVYLLKDFEQNLKHFVKIFPREYKKALQKKGELF
jgi:glutamate synthase (NADPH/NADH) large chain